MAINTAALRAPRPRLDRLVKGYTGCLTSVLGQAPLKVRLADMNFCRDNAEAPDHFSAADHMTLIYRARGKEAVPTAILRQLEADIVTSEAQYFEIHAGRYCHPNQATIVMEQNTVLVKLTRGFGESLPVDSFSWPFSLANRDGNESLRDSDLLVNLGIVEVQTFLEEINAVLSPVGLKLAIPGEPLIDVFIGRFPPIGRSFSLACSTSFIRYGEPALNEQYVLKHENRGSGTRSEIGPNSPASFLLEVMQVPRKIV